MFEFLFKYAPIVFTEGIISAKNLPQYALLFAFFFVICASAILFANWKTVSPITNYLKTTFIVLRYFVLIALFLILIEPVITITQVVQKKSAVLLLVDSSKSMQIKDAARSQTRTEVVKNYLWGTENDLLARLKENFIVLPFSFSSGITALDSSNNLQNDGEITDLASALSFAVSRLKSQPVSAIILISDGNNIAWETNESQQASDPLK